MSSLYEWYFSILGFTDTKHSAFAIAECNTYFTRENSAETWGHHSFLSVYKDTDPSSGYWIDIFFLVTKHLNILVLKEYDVKSKESGIFAIKFPMHFILLKRKERKNVYGNGLRGAVLAWSDSLIDGAARLH